MFYKLKREISTFYFIYTLATYRGFNTRLAGQVRARDSRTLKVSCRARHGEGVWQPRPRGSGEAQARVSA